MRDLAILFTVDDGYFDQLMVSLYSIVQNTAYDTFRLYVIQAEELEQTANLTAYCQAQGIEYYPLIIGRHAFKEAPVTERYPESIYYRLLAHEFLPEDLDRILYLDADILVINDLWDLFQQDLTGYLYAAASHSKVIDVTTSLNRKRLKNEDLESYYNSGVLLMNLDLIRQEVHSEDIFTYIRENQAVLFLPDQDVLNALYGQKILSVPDQLYNYDTRYGLTYQLISEGEWNLDWVIDHTVVLHFCGIHNRNKPWNPESKNQFAALYKHYRHRLKLELKALGVV